MIRNVRLLNTWPPFREGGAGGILISRTSARDLVQRAVASFSFCPLSLTDNTLTKLKQDGTNDSLTWIDLCEYLILFFNY